MWPIDLAKQHDIQEETGVAADIPYHSALL